MSDTSPLTSKSLVNAYTAQNTNTCTLLLLHQHLYQNIYYNHRQVVNRMDTNTISLQTRAHALCTRHTGVNKNVHTAIDIPMSENVNAMNIQQTKSRIYPDRRILQQMMPDQLLLENYSLSKCVHSSYSQCRLEYGLHTCKRKHSYFHRSW